MHALVGANSFAFVELGHHLLFVLVVVVMPVPVPRVPGVLIARLVLLHARSQAENIADRAPTHFFVQPAEASRASKRNGSGMDTRAIQGELACAALCTKTPT